MSVPKLSIITPVHSMEGAGAFLQRLHDSLAIQTFKDFEWIGVRKGKMAETTNEAIRQANGEIIKILFMDDYLAHENALQNIVDGMDSGWLASGCLHTHDGKELINPHYPTYHPSIRDGVNTIGSPSVVAIRKGTKVKFDERMSFFLDCDWYTRLYEEYGPPVLLNSLDVVIGLGPHQTTNIMTTEEKQAELTYMLDKNRHYG